MSEIINQIPTWVSNWIIFPMLIVIARMCDVSLGTLRIILIGKGYKKIAPVIGFAEILIWIFVAGHIMQNLDQVQYYFAYALGFACGTFLGIKIDEKISLGQVMIQIITNHDSLELTESFKNHNVNFTTVDAQGKFGPVKIILILTQRHLLKESVKIIESNSFALFYSIEDVRYVKGNLPGGKNPILSSFNPFQRTH